MAIKPEKNRKYYRSRLNNIAPNVCSTPVLTRYGDFSLCKQVVLILCVTHVKRPCVSCYSLVCLLLMVLERIRWHLAKVSICLMHLKTNADRISEIGRVGSKIIRALEIIRTKKLVYNVVL